MTSSYATGIACHTVVYDVPRGRAIALEHKPTFGTLLKRYRIASGLTQEELAAQAGMSIRGVSGLERGARHTTYSGSVDQNLFFSRL